MRRMQGVDDVLEFVDAHLKPMLWTSPPGSDVVFGGCLVDLSREMMRRRRSRGREMGRRLGEGGRCVGLVDVGEREHCKLIDIERDKGLAAVCVNKVEEGSVEGVVGAGGEWV